MRNYYYENVAVEESRLVNCLNALCRLEERPFARLMTRAIQEAHTESVPPVAPDDFWKNLFVGARPLITPNKDRDPRTVPDAPYEYLDAQDAVKYLSDIGRNRKAADGTPITDSLVVLNYFHISDKPDQLRAYNDVLRKLMGDRNDWIGHVIEARDKKAGMKDATQYRDLLLQAVEPLCTTQWSGQQRSIALREKILREFYDNLGPMEYTLESIMRYAHIDLGKREQVEELLVAADFTLQDGRVTLEINPTIFADELTQVVLRTDLSLESRAQQLKLRLPGGEIIMHEMLLRETEGDLQYISQHALEELLERGEADAQCEMGWRWVEKKSGDHKENCRKAAPWFEKAAEQGHPQAMRVLGRWLIRGNVIDKDLDKGILLLRLAVEKGDGRAHYFLGDAYEKGLVASQSPEKAFSLYEKGAQLEDIYCQLERARCLMEGVGTPKNEEEALFIYQKLDLKKVPEASWKLAEYYKDTDEKKYAKYFKNAFDEDHPAAQRTVAYEYLSGYEREKGVALMEQAANGGDAEAQDWLGYSYESGTDEIPKDEAKAFRWYLRAAKQNHTVSYLHVGICYLKGIGTPVNVALGRQWLHKVNDPTLAEAAWDALGHSYLSETSSELKEKGIEYLEKASGFSPVQAALYFADHYRDDPRTALFLYGRAGNLGEPKGFFEAARLCEETGNRKGAYNGYRLAANAIPEAAYKAAKLLTESPKNAEVAQKFLRSAAQKNYAPAQFELFKVYSKGIYDIQPNMEEALSWLRKAADNGYTKAYHQLGNLYAVGCLPHIKKDIQIASEWYDKALEDPNYEHADKVRDNLNKIWKK